MRNVALVGTFLLVPMTGTGRAEPGFDEKYQRDFNIFNHLPVIGTRCHELRITDEVARFVSYTEQMLMQSLFSMCLRRRLNRRLNRSLRPPAVGFKIMTG